MIPRLRRDFLLLCIFTLTVLLGLIVACEGFPFMVHWDEELVFNRPFQRLYQYLQGDFSSSTNIFDLLMLLWYGLGYLLGKAIGLWQEFDQFKEQLILQEGLILVWGRLLSAIYVATGNCIIYLQLKPIYATKKGLWLAGLGLVFNPILFPSLFLIKFDALVYLLSCLLLVNCYQYVVLRNSSARKTIYFLGLFSLFLRADLFLWCALVILWDVKTWWEGKLQSPMKEISRPGMLALSLGFLLTLLPFNLIYSILFPQPSVGLTMSLSYGANIFQRIVLNVQKEEYLQLMFDTGHFYGGIILTILGPIIPIVFFTILFRESKTRFFGLHLAIFLGILLFFGVKYIHYSVTPIICMLSLSLFSLPSLFPNWYRTILICLFLYFLSLSVPYLLFLVDEEHPALAARSFLLENSTDKELLAIETLSGAAGHPHLIPCRIEERMQAALKLSRFGGTELKIRQKRGATNPCRRQIDICEVNYLSSNPKQSSEFVNTYDPSHLEKLSPSWLVTQHPLRPNYPSSLEIDSFFQYAKAHYELDTLFHKNEGIIDPRIQMINIRRTFYIYKRKDSLPIFQFSK